MKTYEKEVQQAFIDNEKAVLKKLEETYADALFEINDKIERLLARKDADLQHVIYQVEYQKALKSQVETILETLHNNEFETVSEYLTKSYEDGFIGSMYSLHKQNIPMIIPIDQRQVSKAIQHETKLSESLYASLGKDTKRLSKQIAGEISRGISNAATYDEMSRNIASFSNIPKNRAMTIARTEAHRIQCTATADAQVEAKKRGADVVKQWDATLDGNTRPNHRKLDGQIREIDEAFEVDGYSPMYPGDFGDPAEDCNCRCALLQRARWALDESELETLKERAEFFDLDKTKDFDDFKKKYLKASERVRSNAQKINNRVVYLHEVTVNGITYKVDGKHVVLDNTKHEKDIAELIGKHIGEIVKMVPRVVYPQGVSTPDYMIGNKKYDLKEPVGSGKHVLYNMINKKKSQADNFIFDITNCPLDYDDIKMQIEEIYKSSHTAFVNEIIIVDNGKVNEKFNKKRN